MAFVVLMFAGLKTEADRLVKAPLVAKRLVEVAFVVVPLTTVKFVMVDEALFTRMPPDKVDRPETVRADRVPTEVREEATTAAPRVVAESTWMLFTVNAPPVARFRLPEVRVTPPLKEEVAELPTMVVVAVPPTYRVPRDDSKEVDA